MVTKKKSIDRAMRWFIVPGAIISMIFLFIDSLRKAGFVYFVLSLFIIFIYGQKAYRKNLNGFTWNKTAFFGLLVAVAFLILSYISPAFSLLTPVISLSVATSLRYFIIWALAPDLEEHWREGFIAFLKKHYPKLTFNMINLIQAIIFAAIHVTAYGVFLDAYDTLSQLYGGVLAISGSLVAAAFFGVISGYMMKKWKNTAPSMIAHSTINFWLTHTGLIVVASLLSLL